MGCWDAWPRLVSTAMLPFRKVLLWMSSRSAAADAIHRATSIRGGADRTNSRDHRGSRSGTRDRTRVQHHSWPDNATGRIFDIVAVNDSVRRFCARRHEAGYHQRRRT